MNYFFILSSLFFQLFLKQADSDKVTWEKYSNENCKVSMEFPGKVEESMTEQEAAKTYKALYSTDKNVTYLLAMTVHENELDDHMALAEVSLAAFAESLNGKILQQENYKYKKYKGIEATLTMEEQNAEIRYRVILIGQIQYQIALIFLKTNAAETEDIERFFKSFKYLK